MDPSMAEIFTKVGGSPGRGGVSTNLDDDNRGGCGLRPIISSETLDKNDTGTGVTPEKNENTIVPQVVNQVATHLLTGVHASSISQMEVVNQVVAQLAAGLNASSISQMQGGGRDDDYHISIDMPPHQQVPATMPPPAPVQLVSAIWTTSLLTMVPAISTALYKPARGIVFSHNKLAYYSVLSAIIAAGLGEATTAFWLSRPGGASRRRLTFGRAVLCASILPLIIVLGIAGFGFMEG